MTTEQEIEIINKKNNGVKIKQLMSDYSIKSVKTIYDIIKRNGIKKIGNKKYEVNDNYFSIIDSEEKAYWLGFLYADGYVRMKDNRSGQLKLKLSSKDREHIVLFNKCLSSNYPIKDSISTIIYKGSESRSSLSEVSIYNTKIVNDLINNGCMNKKTFLIRLPNINKSMYRHFIRGYFDGDGCISISKKGHFSIKIISNRDFISDISDYLLSIGINRVNIRDNGRVKNLMIENKQDCLRFRKIIYDDSVIFLKRKFEIFTQIV
jgi:intein/homing endonuclease